MFEPLRLVLVGKTGVGKSAAGNAILGETQFKSSLRDASVTTECAKGEGEVTGKSVVVVDTPGLFDTTVSNEEATKEIVKCIQMSFPGPHAFLVVLKLGRFTEEEQETVRIIQEIFGEPASKYSMVLFTHSDNLDEGETINDFVNEARTNLKDLIKSCGNRYHAISGRDIKNRDQAKQLLEKVESMMETNHVKFYANEFYQLEEKRKQAEAKIQKEIDDIKKRSEDENEKMKQEKVAIEVIVKTQNENMRIVTEMMEEIKKTNAEAIKTLEAQIKEKTSERVKKEEKDKEEKKDKKAETNQKGKGGGCVVL